MCCLEVPHLEREGGGCAASALLKAEKLRDDFSFPNLGLEVANLGTLQKLSSFAFQFFLGCGA